jgi:hypothetical protein
LKNEQQHLAEMQQQISDEMELLREVNQRATRIESRMVQLGDYVGANLRTKMRVHVERDDTGVWVEIDALDVSLSRIVTSLREQGIRKGWIAVNLNGRQITRIDLDKIQ